MTTKNEPPGTQSEAQAEDPAEKFERFGAHEIPHELRQQLLQTELRRVDPERFQDTEPPRALAHAPKAPPAAKEVDETRPKVIVDGIAQPQARSLDAAVTTVPDARSRQKLERLTRCLAVGIALGVVLALVAVALASWAHDAEPPPTIVIEPAPVEPAADVPAAAIPARATESAPTASEARATAARPAPAARRTQTKPSAAPQSSASAAAKREGLFETLPRPPM